MALQTPSHHFCTALRSLPATAMAMANVVPRSLIAGGTPSEAARLALRDREAGWDVLAVGPKGTKDAVAQSCGQPATLGNQPCARVRERNLRDVPMYEGHFDQGTIGSAADLCERDILFMALLTRPGRMIELSKENVPPLENAPLEPAGANLWQIPEGYKAPWLPIDLEGLVEVGAGKGSAALGFPTANIAASYSQLRTGVYVAWGKVEGHEVEGAVVNVGNRPTVDDEENVTIEAHLFGDHGSLHGMRVKLRLLGWIRPEMALPGLDPLVDMISNDVVLAKEALSSVYCQHYLDGV